jgi:hypothetical protein
MFLALLMYEERRMEKVKGELWKGYALGMERWMGQ